VIITARLNPADYGFPVDSSRLQIFTEFHDPPEPDRIRRPIRAEQNERVRRNMVTPDLIDEILGFGEVVMATGRASLANTEPGSSAAPVAKEFRSLKQRAFLIESVECASIEAELRSLPPPKTALLQYTKRGKWSKELLAIPKAHEAELANLNFNRHDLLLGQKDVWRPYGVAIDYIQTLGGTINSTTVFQSDTTYFVSGQVTYNGSVSIEGAATFKFRNSTGTTPTPVTTYININGSLTCKSSQYFPAVLTAVDDDTVGHFIPELIDDGNGNLISTVYTGSTVDPGPDGILATSDDVNKYYANPGLWLNYLYFPTLSNLRFCFANEAIRVEGNFTTTGATVSHSQFVNCVKGIVLTGSGSGPGSAVPLTINNALLAHVQQPFTVNTESYGSMIYHCTVNESTRLVTATSSCNMTFVNSIFANISSAPSGPVSLSGNNNGFYAYTPPQFGSAATRYTSSSNPFQAVGQGSHYLDANNIFRAKGSTSIGSSLINDLKKRTTQAPVLLKYPNYISEDTIWTPLAPRYVSGQPDLGYYYDPIHYLVSWVCVSEATLTVASGTAIGFLPDLYTDPLGDEYLLEI
jgi:hypothetical protein